MALHEHDDDQRDDGEGDQRGSGTNCTDEVKRESYREALILKIAVESAQETAKRKLGEYRAYLKAAGKKGVSTDAIAFALQCRFEDPDLILIEQRERLKMLDLSGFLPGIRDKLLQRFDVEEPTRNEEEEMQEVIALDRGTAAGRTGKSRDENPYPPASLGFVRWVDGWLSGQRAIADEMDDNAKTMPSEPTREARPARPARRASGGIKPDTAASVAATLAADNTMPGEMPAAVH